MNTSSPHNIRESIKSPQMLVNQVKELEKASDKIYSSLADEIKVQKNE